MTADMYDDTLRKYQVILYIDSIRGSTIVEIVHFKEPLAFDNYLAPAELEEKIIDTYNSYFCDNNLDIETFTFQLNHQLNTITIHIEPLSIKKKINMIKLSVKKNNNDGNNIAIFIIHNFIHKSYTSEELKEELTNFFVDRLQLINFEIISMASNSCPLGQSIFFLSIEKLDVCVCIW
jgi:hypothetical protein